MQTGNRQKRILRKVIPPVVVIAPVLLVYAIRHYFNLHAEQPLSLISGLVITYLAMAILGFGGHTFFETLYVAIFLTIGGMIIISNEFPSFWAYGAACLLLGSWYNLVLWKMSRVFDHPPAE